MNLKTRKQVPKLLERMKVRYLLIYAQYFANTGTMCFDNLQIRSGIPLNASKSFLCSRLYKRGSAIVYAEIVLTDIISMNKQINRCSAS